jgi:hypothetical protein
MERFPLKFRRSLRRAACSTADRRSFGSPSNQLYAYIGRLDAGPAIEKIPRRDCSGYLKWGVAVLVHRLDFLSQLRKSRVHRLQCKARLVRAETASPAAVVRNSSRPEGSTYP